MADVRKLKWPEDLATSDWYETLKFWSSLTDAEQAVLCASMTEEDYKVLLEHYKFNKKEEMLDDVLGSWDRFHDYWTKSAKRHIERKI